MLLEAAGAHGVEEAERPDAVHVRRVLRHLERHLVEYGGCKWITVVSR